MLTLTPTYLYEFECRSLCKIVIRFRQFQNGMSSETWDISHYRLLCMVGALGEISKKGWPPVSVQDFTAACHKKWTMSAYGWQMALIWSWQAWTISTLNCTHAFQCSMYPSLYVLTLFTVSFTFCVPHKLLSDSLSPDNVPAVLCFSGLNTFNFHSDISSQKEHPIIPLQNVIRFRQFQLHLHVVEFS